MCELTLPSVNSCGVRLHSLPPTKQLHLHAWLPLLLQTYTVCVFLCPPQQRYSAADFRLLAYIDEIWTLISVSCLRVTCKSPLPRRRHMSRISATVRCVRKKGKLNSWQSCSLNQPHPIGMPVCHGTVGIWLAATTEDWRRDGGNGGIRKCQRDGIGIEDRGGEEEIGHIRFP